MDDILGYRLLNRDGSMPKDGWYHIAPIGTFLHKPTGVDQVIDNKSIDSMVAAFKKDEAKLGDHFPGLLVDFDHFSSDTEKTSEAAGWIEDLQNRTGKGEANDDGLWAKIEWSDTGDAAVKGKRYRLVSPVWNPGDCESVGKNTIRPLRLDRVAVTNDPNLKGMNPLSNRASKKDDDETDEESIPLAAQRRTSRQKTAATALINRSRYISFDGERIPIAADKRRSVRNAA